MFDPLRDIEEFHRKFGLEYDGPPRSLPTELKEFRTEFMHEEVDEYIDNAATLIGELDALVDLAYVLFGTVYMQGLSSKFAEAWRRVHEANMKKVRAENARDSKRNSTYDVIKPPGWTPPDLHDLVS